MLFQTALKPKGRLKIELENNPDRQVFIFRRHDFFKVV